MFSTNPPMGCQQWFSATRSLCTEYGDVVWAASDWKSPRNLPSVAGNIAKLSTDYRQPPYALFVSAL